jgi:hypothetical protein
MVQAIRDQFVIVAAVVEVVVLVVWLWRARCASKRR